MRIININNNTMESCSTNKQPMTDAERIELGKKLDEDLENFMNSFEKRKYTEGWAADQWEEEMEKHPFFMKNAPEPGETLSPLMEGLQQLKYDPNENTPEELASAYKEDGNFNFKHKNYRLAIIAYTEAIKIKCGNEDVQATLYNNRSAAHYFLQNYRSSLRDAELAIALKPDYDKALVRAAHCYYAIELYEDAIKVCDDLLNKNGPNEELSKLRLNSVNANKANERDCRKKQLRLSKLHQDEQKLIHTILSLGIQVDGGKDCLKLEYLEPHIPQLVNNRVHLDENGKLIWPVILTYPEYCVMDFVQEFHEDDNFQIHLNEVLLEFTEWDNDKKYSPDNINLYMEFQNKKLHKVDVNRTLGEILRLQGCVVKGGTPSFIVISADSSFETHFLKRYV